MEITSPNLLNYIRIYDNILNEKTLQTFLKICKEKNNFQEAGISYSRDQPNLVNKQIRDVKSWELVNIGEKNRTNVLWANYFSFKFVQLIEK